MLSLAPSNYSYLKIGQRAPGFVGTYLSKKNKTPRKISLAEYNDRKLILYFYPKDHTPFCTLQAKSFRDNYKKLKRHGFEVIGVSTDTSKTHSSFIKKHKLPFKLISDPEHIIIDKYGAWAKKSLFGKKYWRTNRMTFIIENGIITEIIIKVKSKNHALQVLEHHNRRHHNKK
ncbi:MAG: peroxiredoxin [Bacteroidetes bacterium]|nr:peroxiredoxin [Bacteroidota bacterium]